VTATPASSPSRIAGQVIEETLPQFSPAMIVGVGEAGGHTGGRDGLDREDSRHGHQMDRSPDELSIDLLELCPVALHDPLRYPLIAVPGGVLNEQSVGAARGRAGGCPHRIVVNEVGLQNLGALACDVLYGLLGRSGGNIEGGTRP
jgi:hypothetical protein